MMLSYKDLDDGNLHFESVRVGCCHNLKVTRKYLLVFS